ncbi:hypothetical protein B296_00024025 [Ensete ventricosum]|uniref:Uncharacterized protein n=1 Tax=Ensete ventricosum TaxID=4639 RepID=A0A426Z5V4_ENSVE|nr:hypothetical protein B296_00024025 [Ensete ventricosum]
MCRLRSACSNCSRLGDGGGSGSDVRPRPPIASVRSRLSDATITLSSCLLITIFNRTTPSPSSLEMTIPRVSSSTASSAVTLGVPRQKHVQRPWPQTRIDNDSCFKDMLDDLSPTACLGGPFSFGHNDRGVPSGSSPRFGSLGPVTLWCRGHIHDGNDSICPLSLSSGLVLMRFGGAWSPFPLIWRKISVRVELRGVVGGRGRLKFGPSILLLGGPEGLGSDKVVCLLHHLRDCGRGFLDQRPK